MGIRIDALPTTISPNLLHYFPAMKDGLTVQLSLQQAKDVLLAGTSIGDLGTDKRLGAHIPGGTVLDANLMVDSGWYFYNSTTCVNGPLGNVPPGAGNGYIFAFKQAQTGPANYANKQIFYEAAGHRTFTRYRWYTAGWQAWVEITIPVVTGKQSMFIRATDMLPRVDIGPSLSVAQTATSAHVLATLDYDGAVNEYAAFQVDMPKRWNAGQISFQAIWMGTAAGSGGVVWQMAGSSVGDNDSVDPSMGATLIEDTYLGPNVLHKTAESPNMNLTGSPAVGDTLFIRIGRSTTDASDTLAQDAKLIGIMLNYTSTAGNDA